MVRCTVVLLAVLVGVSAGCGGGGSGGADGNASEGAQKSEAGVVGKFADQLEGCLASEASRTYADGPIGRQAAGDLETAAVKALSNDNAGTDFFVFRSGAEAKAASRELASYRASGGKTELRGLLVLAYNGELGNVGCIETARKAAGPSLPDPPPAAAKLTSADRLTVLRAGRVGEYCADKEAQIQSAAFGNDGAAQRAVRDFLPVLARAPDVEVKQQDNYSVQTPREVAQSIADAIDGPPACLDQGLVARLRDRGG